MMKKETIQLCIKANEDWLKDHEDTNSYTRQYVRGKIQAFNRVLKT